MHNFTRLQSDSQFDRYNSIIFESLATNEFAFVLGPGDLSSDNIQNLTTPELEQCFRPPISDSFDPTTWHEFSSTIAAGNFDRLSTEECFAFLEKLNPSGVDVLVGLVDEISAADGGNAAFLMTDSYGGSPDVKFMAHDGRNPNKTTGKVRGDVFSRQTFSLGIPTENGTSTLYYNAWNKGSTRDCWEKGGNRAACVAGPSALIEFYPTGGWQSPTRQEFEKRLHQYVLNGDEDGINKIQINTTLHCVPNAPNPEDVYNATAHKINGCLAVKTEENCKLLYSPPICIIIIFSMMAKLAVIALTLRDGRSREAPLLTIGDAIASFMKCPDSTTEGFCWSSGSDFRRGKWKTPKTPGWAQDSTANTRFPDMQPNHKIITFGHLQKPQRWMKVPSLMQWLATLSL